MKTWHEDSGLVESTISDDPISAAEQAT